MATLVIMPRQGQSVESCVITAFNKKVGDTVEKGDVLFSYETDKSSFEEPAPEAGKILAIFREEGDDVPCLENVLVIGNDGEDISAFIPKAEADAAPVLEEKVYGEPDPVQPIKEEYATIDDFSKLDLRVCKIVKCQEIRKSHSCYKLTLNDGIGERVIVSSIKHDYKPEELVGKKIIVIANLTPTRITGVNSNGMLLAASNNACGCKVVFVDDMVPEGTQIH